MMHKDMDAILGNAKPSVQILPDGDGPGGAGGQGDTDSGGCGVLGCGDQRSGASEDQRLGELEASRASNSLA